MSKAKSIVITTLLAIAVFVAAFFAAISFPATSNNPNGLYSISSNIPLGADFTGYAYTVVYPEGVQTAEYYESLTEDKKQDYEKSGSLYVNKETNPDIEELKAAVAHDAAIINKRLAKRAYSSYSVAVGDGLIIRASVPTNYTYSQYKYRENNEVDNADDLTVVRQSLNALTAFGELTLRTSDTKVTGTGGASDTDLTKIGNDDWVDISKVSGASTYSLTYGYEDDLSIYFKSIYAKMYGSTPTINIKFNSEGEKMFADVVSRAKSTSSQVVYFFVGDRMLLPLNCSELEATGSLPPLRVDTYGVASSMAIVMSSALDGDALSLNYNAKLMTYGETSAPYGENSALLMFIACIIILVAASVLLIVKYKRLGALLAFITLILALVELYALCLLSIQLTLGVLLTSVVCLGLFVSSNVALLSQIKRFTETGRTMQASIKEGYKKVMMTVTDIHIVLAVVALLLATICVGEVAACGLVAVVGVVASYALYWFTRFMWYVTSSPVKDKFKFAGLKKVVHDYD